MLHSKIDKVDFYKHLISTVTQCDIYCSSDMGSSHPRMPKGVVDYIIPGRHWFPESVVLCPAASLKCPDMVTKKEISTIVKHCHHLADLWKTIRTNNCEIAFRFYDAILNAILNC